MGAKRKNFAEVANEVLLWVCCGRRRPERAGNGDYHWLTTGCCIGVKYIRIFGRLRLCILCRPDTRKDVGWKVVNVYVAVIPFGVSQLV